MHDADANMRKQSLENKIKELFKSEQGNREMCSVVLFVENNRQVRVWRVEKGRMPILDTFGTLGVVET